MLIYFLIFLNISGSRRWEKIREVDEQPSARCAHAACAWNSYLFIWGGRDRRSPLSDAWAFSIGWFLLLSRVHGIVFVVGSIGRSNSS